MTESDYLGAARLHRHRGGSWERFWERHAAAIKDNFPDAGQRKLLVGRLQDAVLMGVTGEPVQEIQEG